MTKLPTKEIASTKLLTSFCTAATISATSKIWTFGNLSIISRCNLARAVAGSFFKTVATKVCGAPSKTPGRKTKTNAVRVLRKSSLRILAICTWIFLPEMSKVSQSPTPTPKVLLIPSSTETCASLMVCAAPFHQFPARSVSFSSISGRYVTANSRPMTPCCWRVSRFWKSNASPLTKAMRARIVGTTWTGSFVAFWTMFFSSSIWLFWMSIKNKLGSFALRVKSNSRTRFNCKDCTASTTNAPKPTASRIILVWFPGRYSEFIAWRIENEPKFLIFLSKTVKITAAR